MLHSHFVGFVVMSWFNMDMVWDDTDKHIIEVFTSACWVIFHAFVIKISSF